MGIKIGNLYNLKSFQRFSDHIANNDAFGSFADSAFGGMVLARTLTAVDPRIFEKKYPELTFVNAGIEINNTGGDVLQIQSLRVQELGGFSTSNDASTDKGKISLTAEDSLIKVIEREASSKWTDTEVRVASMQNINLVQRYLAAHTKEYNRDIDKIGMVGIEENFGLLNNPAFTSTAAGQTAGLSTSQQAYDEIAELITAQRDGVANTIEYSTNKVIMPVRVMNVLSRKILNTAAGSATVITALRDNFPGVEFLSSFRAEAIAAGGDVAVSTVVAFNNSSEAMVTRLPRPLEIGEIIKVSSFDMVVDSKFRIAGLDVLEGTAGRLLTGF